MERARAILPEDVFAYFAAGAGAERTLARQERAWGEVLLRPRVLRDVSATSPGTQVLGHPVASPVLVAPTAAHKLAHPEGEVASPARPGPRGGLLVLSMRSSSPVEDVAAAAGPFWQQLYVLQDRGVTDEIGRRAAAAGALALVVTVDTPRVARKRAGFPAALPSTGIIEALDHRDVADPRLMQAEDVGPRDLERLAEATGLPIVAKGVLTAEAARTAWPPARPPLSSRPTAVASSTGSCPPRWRSGGGRAVGDRVEVYVDGGVRTGSHVLKALALGPGRAHRPSRDLGPRRRRIDGVRGLLDEMTSEVEEALALAGCPSCTDVGPTSCAGRTRTARPVAYAVCRAARPPLPPA